MDRTSKPLYEEGPREVLVAALSDIASMTPDALIVGERGVGKTTLVKALLVPERTLLDTGPDILYCAGVEIYAALFIRESERFLNRLAEAPLVIIDEVESLLNKDKGPESLALLLAERKRQGYRTILIHDGNAADVEEMLPLSFKENYTRFTLEGLDEEQLAVFALRLLEGYAQDESPRFDQETAEAIVSVDPDLKAIDSAALFLMTASDHEATDVLGTEEVVAALTS